MNSHHCLKHLTTLLFCLLLSVCSFAQQHSDLITIDQFGYRTMAKKTAVIKNPQLGSDKNKSITPGSVYQVVDAISGQSVYEGAPVPFNNGNTDAASGDKVWWFDFSAVTKAGRYYIKDTGNNLTSYVFQIKDDVYNDVLKHAIRMFFYQRAGFEKEEKYAGKEWADLASHVGTLQDKNCRLYNKKNDASTERDLHGGWYDAGDYNKYTAWTANYVEAFLLTYQDNPEVFTDDYNIPESGNGIPDIIDEAKWGMDWLLRMQNSNGSLLSVVGLSGAFPPSAAKGQSLYGPENTVATISAVKAFALGAMVFDKLGMNAYAATLKEAALKAWKWADENPKVIFHNNSSSNGSSGLAAGDQEVGDNDDSNARMEQKSTAGFYLYELTGDVSYLKTFETEYKNFPMYKWWYYMGQYWQKQHLMYLKYLSLPDGNSAIKESVKNYLVTAFNKTDDYAGKLETDGYRSFIKDYNWGSNQYKSEYGLLFYLWAKSDIEPDKSAQHLSAAEDYIHYIHGVNPLNLVYLTNMNRYGASNSLKEIYHTWFNHDSSKWDRVGTSTYGPAPGYLAGGPNSSYTWDGCCDNGGCGSSTNNALCHAETIPVGEPAAKMYKDFNTNWPLNSWSLTEPSCGYQVAYIRLLSKFATPPQGTGMAEVESFSDAPYAYPNPLKQGEKLFVRLPNGIDECSVVVYNVKGEMIYSNTFVDAETSIDTSSLPKGVYIVKAHTNQGSVLEQKVQIM